MPICTYPKYKVSKTAALKKVILSFFFTLIVLNNLNLFCFIAGSATFNSICFISPGGLTCKIFLVLLFIAGGYLVHLQVRHKSSLTKSSFWTRFRQSLFEQDLNVPVNFILTSDYLPYNTDYFPTLANGFLGLKLFNDTVFVAGIYNGHEGESHRARIPSTLPYIISNRSFHLANNGCLFVHNMFSSVHTVSCLRDVQVEQRYFAHAKYSQLLVTEIAVLSVYHDHWHISLHNSSGLPSTDMDFNKTYNIEFDPDLCECAVNASDKKASNSGTCTQCLYLPSARYMHGRTKVSEQANSNTSEIHIIYTRYPKVLTGRRGSVSIFTFITAFGRTKQEAQFYYTKSLQEQYNLFPLHQAQWRLMWKNTAAGMTSDNNLNKLITSAFYYLLSSFPSPQSSVSEFFGVSPGGPSNGGDHQDYWGHVFWDQDFWMMPALLPFYPELVKMVIQYRIARLPYACSKSKSFGFSGAMFPWETAFTGSDVCPGEIYVEQEIHVTADIVHLLEQYIYATGNWDIFSEQVAPFSSSMLNRASTRCANGTRAVPPSYSCDSCAEASCLTPWDLLRDTAAFWESRVRFDPSRNAYVIDDVMGPDEWNAPVNNSAFTNAAAASNLRFAADVATRLGVCFQRSKAWLEIARLLIVAVDEMQNFHPEFDGFVSRVGSVKQADTIMLGFPLMLEMSDSLRYNDLLIYNLSTSRRGPAMTWGMFCINWLSLSMTKSADEMYLRQLDNVQKPFLIWSEQADGTGATNFLTGIGGYLQSLLYGYLGLRFQRDSLSINPKFPPLSVFEHSSTLSVGNLRYRNFVISVSAKKALSQIRIQLEANPTGECLQITTPGRPEHYLLCGTNQPLLLPFREWILSVSKPAA